MERSTPGPAPSPRSALIRRLEKVRSALLAMEEEADLTPFGDRAASARNLLHYLAFRRFDLRPEQTRLAHWGLSSLGRAEGHVLFNLDAVLGWLHSPEAHSGSEPKPSTGPNPEQGRGILERNARELLGPPRPGRAVRIMVTLPVEAAVDYSLVRALVAGGMDCARINCAHDRPEDWAGMVANIRRAERALGARCRIEMDLAGPKIRTGAMRPGPAVLKIKPRRDPLGRVISPGTLWIGPIGGRHSRAAPADELQVDPEWLSRRRVHEVLRVRDSRGAERTLRIMERAGGRIRLHAPRTIYLTNGTELAVRAPQGRSDRVRIDSLPATEQRLRVEVGDRIVLTARSTPGGDAVQGARGRVARPAHVACTLPEALAYVRRGESVWFDDGRIGGVVRSANPDRLWIEVTHARSGGAKLGSDRGINLPDTDLRLPALPAGDLAQLPFIVRHADLVGFSFVHTASDLERLRSELAALGRPRMGIVLKVETRRAFAELPAILLAGLREPPVGIMIARGDLGVEVGYERLAEVQEEILWLCEAAHIPAIWATQVLEGLTKSGFPSRAEVTDAAMGERAECVMLNKGPHVVEAVRALDSILRRMQSHQAKKTPMLRHLQVADAFFSSLTPLGT